MSQNETDHAEAALLAEIDNELQGFRDFRGHSRNPMTYAGALDLTVSALEPYFMQLRSRTAHA